MPFQVVLGGYFVAIDAAMVAQWIYFTHRNGQRRRLNNDDEQVKLLSDIDGDQLVVD
jgi:hypothetical protein